MIRQLRALGLRVSALVRRRRIEREMADEIESNLQLHIDDNLRAGLTPVEARRQALLALGGVEQAKEEYRDRRGLPWLETLVQDVRYGARMLRRQKTVTAVAVVTLAIGFGPPIAIFTLANWMVLRPVPGVRDPGAVSAYMSGSPSPRGGTTVGRISYLNLHDIVPRLRSLQFAAHQAFPGAVVAANGRPERFAPGQFVSGSYFAVLGVPLQAGRPLGVADDDPGDPVMAAVISDGLWASLFDRDAAAIGGTITINGVRFTVVGVADRGFQGARRFSNDAFWVPGVTEPVVRALRGGRSDDRASGGYYRFVGRLAPGAAWEQADAELASQRAWLQAEYPEDNAKLQTMRFLNEGLIGEVGRGPLLLLVAVMFAASTLVLLIASSNVASLLLMRGIARRDEVAVRQALGAGRWRVLRQHVTEATLLWLLGALGGILVVWAVLQMGVTSRLSLLRVPDLSIVLDAESVIFALLLALLVGLVFSLLPAWNATRVTTGSLLKVTAATATRRFRLAPVLTMVQLAASLSLFVGALMLAATLRNLLTLDLGFDPRNVTAFTVTPPAGASDGAAASYVNAFRDQLAARPGVTGVAIGAGAPFAGGASLVSRIRAREETASGRSGRQEDGAFFETTVQEVLSGDYLRVLAIPMLRGRAFDGTDAAAGEAVVNEALARRLFGTIDVVGRVVEMPQYQQPVQALRIVGVAADARYSSLTEAPPPLLYKRPGFARLAGGATLIARAPTNASLRSAIEDIALSLGTPPPARILTLDEAVAVERGEWDVLTGLMLILAAIASVIATAGVYGVVAFAVASRRAEFGIRMALGASMATVRAQVLRTAAVITAGGLGFGLAGGWGVVQVLRARLVGVSLVDPVVWTTAALILAALVLVASIVPARQATRTSLADTLKAL